jgi:predicted nucleic acid-binding protein
VNLLDTNTVIYFLSESTEDGVLTTIQEAIGDRPPTLSIITEVELLCWNPDDPSLLKPYYAFVGLSTVLPFDQSVKEATIQIRRDYRIKLGDAIIAATARVHQLALVTRNERDFDRIPDLTLLNPFRT